MPVEPTNAVLLEKIIGHARMSEFQFKQINSHLEKLNGQVIKNTRFRWQATIYGSMAIIVVPLLIKEILDRIS